MTITVAWVITGAVVLVGLAAAVLVLFAAWTARQVEKRLPPRGDFLTVDGARIHYIDEGSGPPILFIHGLAGQTGNFTYALLDRLKRDHRVVILDRPGSGYSSHAPGVEATVSAQAEVISHFVQQLGLERPLVAGHSLGGAIALSLALNHPEEVGGLALIAPVTHRPDDVPAAFKRLAIRSPLVRHAVAWTLATPMAIKHSRATLETLFHPQQVPPDFPIRGAGLLILRPRSFVAASRDLAAPREDLDAMPARYAELKIPVGVLYGTGDRILDANAHCAALADLPGVDIELIEGGGHMILIASADRAADFIVRMAQRTAAHAARANAA